MEISNAGCEGVRRPARGANIAGFRSGAIRGGGDATRPLEQLAVDRDAGGRRSGDGVEDLVHAPDHVEQIPMALVQVAGRELVREEH